MLPSNVMRECRFLRDIQATDSTHGRCLTQESRLTHWYLTDIYSNSSAMRVWMWKKSFLTNFRKTGLFFVETPQDFFFDNINTTSSIFETRSRARCHSKTRSHPFKRFSWNKSFSVSQADINQIPLMLANPIWYTLPPTRTTKDVIGP